MYVLSEICFRITDQNIFFAMNTIALNTIANKYAKQELSKLDESCRKERKEMIAKFCKLRTAVLPNSLYQSQEAFVGSAKTYMLICMLYASSENTVVISSICALGKHLLYFNGIIVTQKKGSEVELLF